MKQSKVDLNSTKLLCESYKWEFPESQKNFKALQKEFPKLKKEQLKDIFSYYDESFAETHRFLKTNDFKTIKRLFDHNAFKNVEEEEKNVPDENTKEDSPLKKSPLKEKFESLNKDSPNDHEPQVQKPPNTEIKIQPLKENILTTFSKSFLLILFDFFDPMTLVSFGITCKYLHEVTSHIQLYKKFCIILFSNKNPLPFSSPFTILQEYINKNPLEFDEITRQRANFDIRSLVWGKNNYLDDYKTPSSFYKQFGNWKNCFLQVPRVCLKGYYVLKEKYIKIGEKDFNQTYDPIIIVEYYRYLRFFDDGIAIMAISAMKLPVDKVKKMFKKALASDEAVVENPLNLFLNQNTTKNATRQTVLKGEYLRKEGKVFARFCSKGSSVFEYELLIKSSEEGKNDKLIVENKINRELTTNYVLNDNDQRASGVKMFEFKKVKEFGLDIKDMRLKNVSL